MVFPHALFPYADGIIQKFDIPATMGCPLNKVMAGETPANPATLVKETVPPYGI